MVQTYAAHQLLGKHFLPMFDKILFRFMAVPCWFSLERIPGAGRHSFFLRSTMLMVPLLTAIG